MSKIRQLMDTPCTGDLEKDKPLHDLAKEIILDPTTSMDQKKTAMRRIDEMIHKYDKKKKYRIKQYPVTDEDIEDFIEEANAPWNMKEENK